ncbi:MAG TPA: hypothetical protein VML54_04200 [Candidatus Limnocylindrales bacterium]|nr:hypothetical protein [Candidatus Limnocylindrales bacterium]
MVFLLKLVLVPALVASVTLAARRWGPRVAGLLTALPIVTGPALLFFAIEQGAAFAAEAAQGALVALVAVAAAGLAYAWMSVRASWGPSLAASWTTFAALSLLLHRVHLGPVPALVAACASFAVVPRLLPAATGARATPRPWALDLPLRMLSAMTLVLAVTELADRLGPGLSGAFTPFPVALTVLLAFTHAREGAATAIRFLRGFFTGMWSFAAFCFVAALAIVPLGRLAGLLLACAVVLPVHGAVLWWTERTRAGG